METQFTCYSHEATVDSNEIDYENFREYTEPYNLKSKLKRSPKRKTVGTK
jgi:hypothetical protein